MQADISLIPEPFNTQVEQLWELLEEKYGLKYIRVTPIPHFTWQLGEGYQDEEVISRLDELTQRIEPFEVCTRGLNHFAGEKPVLFIFSRDGNPRVTGSKICALDPMELIPYSIIQQSRSLQGFLAYLCPAPA